jgi:hypothetical protein
VGMEADQEVRSLGASQKIESGSFGMTLLKNQLGFKIRACMSKVVYTRSPSTPRYLC